MVNTVSEDYEALTQAWRQAARDADQEMGEAIEAMRAADPPSDEQYNFLLYRHEDVSGHSGKGVVADGTVFPGGKAVMFWRARPGKVQSMEIFDSIDELMVPHSHGGATELVWKATAVPTPEQLAKLRGL
jgi:hypothetical protein